MKNALLAVLLLPTLSVAADAKKVKIIVLGDSITRGVRAGVTKEQTFGHLLQQELRKRKIDTEVINLGKGSEQSDHALARLDKTVIALKPDIVTIMYGTNDSYVYPKKTSSNVTAGQFRENLTKMVEKLRIAGITPILMTEPCWGAKAEPNPLGDNHNVNLAKYMMVTREVAKETKTPLVDHFDLWSAKQKEGLDLATWTTDLCHPNPLGHRQIHELLLPVVLKALDK